eukprot:2838793-Alexandrium_andersonii.AAC.1
MNGPELHMEEAVTSAGPQGRNVVVPHSESAEVGDPFHCCSGHRGCCTKRGAPSAQRRNLGVADFR